MMDRKFKLNFLKGSAITSAGTVFSIVFHFLSLMIMTRYISKEDFGIYVLIIVIVWIFNLLSSLGLEISIVKLVSDEKSIKNNNIIVPYISMRIVSLLIFTILFYALSDLIIPLFHEQISQFVLYIPIMFFLVSLRDFFNNLMQGLKLFKKYAIIQITAAIFRIISLLFFLYFEKLTLLNLIYIEIFVPLVIIVFQLFLISFSSLLNRNHNKNTYKQIMSFSTPLYLNSILTFLRERVNVFLVGALLNPVSVAYFDIAGKIPTGFSKIFQSFIVVYFPNLSTLFSKKRKTDAESLMNKSINFLSIGMSFIVLVSFLFKDEIVVLMFSDKYAQSSLAFSLLMLNFYFRAISNIMGYSIVSAGYSSIPVKVNSVSSIINVISSLIFIPIFGFIGAVYSLLIMSIVSQIVYYYFLIKNHIFIEMSEYLKTTFICVTFVIVYSYIDSQILMIKTMFILLYILFSFAAIKEIRDYSGLLFRYLTKHI
jgi:O-antigen/teichoic acid export membrane protein